jgi:flavin-dependent dehydrogenase
LASKTREWGLGVVSGKTKVDVFVIGGGPAGLAAAIAARQRGMSVAVADGTEPPIDKACGEGLMPETIAALGELGVAIHPDAGYRFRGIRFLQQDAQAGADFPQGLGIGIRRTILHEWLIARAEECGVQLMWRAPVSGITEAGVHLAGEFVAARWIVGADGSGSRVRRWRGLDSATRQTQRFATRRHYRVRPWSDYVEFYWGHRAQAYVTPIGCEEVCIVVMAARAEDATFDLVLRDCPQLAQYLDGAELASRERGAITQMHSLRAVYSGNVALVGDASGGVDAITGEGLRLAFQQAIALADAVERNDLPSYARAHRQQARKPALMGDLLLTLARNDRLRTRSIRALAKRPQLFTRLLAAHTGQAALGDWLSTGAQLGWQFLTT